MILAIDAGNSNIVLGCIENGTIISKSRIATNRNEQDYGYAIKLRQAFEFDGINYRSFEGAIISSVVPPITLALQSAVKMVTGLDALVIGAGMKTGLNVRIDDPGTLGADFVADSVAVLDRYPLPAIVIDMGTATTITAVDESRSFIGGAIIPGVHLSFSALASGTSLLPNISIEAPAKCIGTNTADCMKSGAVYGTAALIDGMISRMEEELGKPATIIATGGLASRVIPYCRREIAYDPDLLLRGLEILYEKNVKKK